MSIVHRKGIAFIFPGQGAQSPGMLTELAQEQPVIREVYAEAESVLKYDFWRLVTAGPAEEMNRTEMTQPLMLTAGYSVWRAWLEAGGTDRPDYFGGHSLGEYTALVCAGSLPFDQGLRLVHERARLMSEGAPGNTRMVAVVGLSAAAVDQCCSEAGRETAEHVSAANYNAPEQIVITGVDTAVDRAGELCTAAGARKLMPLAVSVPSHCALLRGAAERYASVLAGVSFQPPSAPVLRNIDGAPHEPPGQSGRDAIAAALVDQMWQPVQWTRLIQTLAGNGVSTLVELGPGRVLTGLIRRIDRNLSSFPVYDPASMDRALKATA